MNIDVEGIIRRVTDTIKTETVIGEPITLGEVTLLPVMNVSFGFGGGGGDGASGGTNQGTGSGAGGGARMTVAGMVVVKGDEVSFVPTNKSSGKSGSFDKLLDALPDLLEKLSGKVSKQKEEAAPDAE